MKLKLKQTNLPSVALPKNSIEHTLPTIAVIDDEPGNVAALEALLKNDYNVVGFTDPLKALETLETMDVDVILTDQRMPGLLGTDLLVRLREHKHYPVSVIVTGYTDVKELVFCINEGLISRYVLKPWEPEDIRAAVRQGICNTKQSQAIKKLVPAQVLSRVFPEGIEALGPGRSTQLRCAVMFADLRGFSSIAESLSPSQAYDLLTECFGLITPVIAEHGGFVDKFLGDGVLAIFDTPGQYNNAAISCAREVERRIRNLGIKMNDVQIQPEGWRVGIGVASGMVTLGTIGCPDRLEITVLGDTVNTAARLEETCKSIGASILVQSDMADRDTPGYRPLGLVPLRGKEKLISIGELINLDRSDCASFDDMTALHALQSTGKFAEAHALLKDICKSYPHDSVLSGILKIWNARQSM